MILIILLSLLSESFANTKPVDLDKLFDVYKYSYTGNKVNCTNNKHHIMCNLLKGPMKSCVNFELFEIDNDLKRRVLAGHNGLRNMRAKSISDQISNMNLLHWDDGLSDMAKQTLYRCEEHTQLYDLSYFPSNFGSLLISNNTFFQNGFPGYKHWLSVAIHTWFKSSSKNKVDKSTLSSDVKLLWPTIRFVGCAGARVAHGTQFVCYYGPNMDETMASTVTKQGKYCSDCPLDRSTCSMVFDGLCGLDIESASNHHQLHLFLIFFVILINF